MDKFDLLIIGGGPAAITIAKNIQDKMKVGIIRPEDHSMIYCAMPYAVEGLLSLEKTLKKDALVTDSKAELIRDKVVKVNFDAKTVKTEKSGEIAYDKLIIATGASPVWPHVEGYNLKGVMTFKTEEDLKKVIERVDNGLKKAVIVGAGAIGIELAQALNERKVETHLVDMADYVLPNMVDYGMVEEAQESLIKSGIHLHLKRTVTSLKGIEKVEGVLLDNDHIIHFDQLDDCSDAENNRLSGLVVFAVGMRATVELFGDTELEIQRDGIVVNNKMETNIKDVYAIGDCCQFTSGITGEVLSGKLATNAVPMGRVVANNLLGKDSVYPGFFNGAATKINNYFIGGTGFSENNAKKFFDVEVGYAEFTTAFPIMPSAKKVRLKLIADKKTHKIVGAQLVSGEPVADKVDTITMAIQYGITVEQLVNFSYASQPYQSFYPAHNLIVKASEDILNKITHPDT
ncbi:MAG: FAD-dependent oxidoreductase, partial [Deltaproteobacteria bacterium]|nr:FAD-dependent oxidoreductase [Deltaproteobacteria bacterium]